MIRTANEYWFHDNDVEYADGDVGDKNHEMIAEDYILNQFIPYERLPEFNDEYGLSKEKLETSAKENYDFIEYLTNKYQLPEQEIIDNIYEYNYINWLLTGDDTLQTPKSKELFDALYDPRKYALEKLGWIRVQGNYIQTYNLDQTHLDEIVNGLREIFGSHDEEFDKHIQNKKFNLDVDGLILNDVPFWEIEDGSVVKRLKQGVDDILDFKRRQLPTPGGYQYKDVGAKKRNYKYCYNLHDLENIAQEVAKMHPYDPAKHFDLISKLSQSTSSDPLKALKERASPYRDYNSIYPQIYIYPSKSMNRWRYLYFDPKNMKQLDNPDYHEKRTTEFTLDIPVQDIMNDLHKIHPSALIDAFESEEEMLQQE